MKPVKVVRNDNEINFDWKRNSPDPAISCDHFQAHWQGVFSCPADTYTFEIQTDDKAQLVIDGKTVIENTFPESKSIIFVSASAKCTACTNNSPT